MLDTIRRWFQRAKVEAAFVRHEWSAHRDHLKEAASKFDTSRLEVDIERAEALVEDAVNRAFGWKLVEGRNAEVAAQTAIREAERVAGLFSRDFKSDIGPLYDELNTIKAALAVAYDEKALAHARLSSAKSSLNAWYARSERHFFFGNGGRELPKRAIFGQDLSDRDYYKRQRDSAAQEIGEAKYEIDRLKARKAQVGYRIGAMKRDREEWYNLRQIGVNSKSAAQQVTTAYRLASEKHQHRVELEAAQLRFRSASVVEQQLPKLRANLQRMKAERKDFEASFALPEERAKRRRRFETEFRARGKS